MAAPLLLLLLLLAALLAPSAARAPAAKASAAPSVRVTVGVVLPEELYSPCARPRVAPALSLALEALQPQLRLAGLAVRTASTEEKGRHGCDTEAAFWQAAELKCFHDPDVLLGMSCFTPRLSDRSFAKYWQLPLLRAGFSSRSFMSSGEVYAGPLGPSLGAFQSRLFQHFNWTARAGAVDWRHWPFYWVEDEFCQVALEETIDSFFVTEYREQLGETVRSIQAKSRVPFIYGSLEMLLKIMHLAHAQNMTNGDYIFFYVDLFGESLRTAGHREAVKPWQSEESNDTGGLREAFQTVLVITPHEPQTPQYRHFENQVVLRAQRDFGVAINDSLGHLVAGCYHDVLLLYLRALNETLREGGSKRDTSRILEKMRSLKIQGVTGMVSINSDNDRDMDFDLWAMKDVGSGEFQVVGHYIASEDRINWTGNILWKKGGPPLDNPPCVFNQDDPSCVNCECE